MFDAIKSGLIEAQIEKQTASINVTSQINPIDYKSLDFLFYAQYDLILETFEMKHAAYLQKKLVSKSKRQQSEQIQRKLDIISQKNHQKIVKYNSAVDHLLNRLQFEWNQRKIPTFHRYYFQKNIDNHDMKNYIESLQKIILNQEKLIKNDIHIVYLLDKTIKARQACLVEFKRFLNGLKDSDVEDYIYTCKERLYYLRSRKEKLDYQIQGYKISKIMDKKVSKDVFQMTKFQQFGELFHHLIKLTLHVIQLISNWKDYLYSITPDLLKKKQQIDYYFEQQNYLLRIINDNNFVQKSFLSNFFKFAPKNDPFLLMPMINLQNDEKMIVQKAIQQNSYVEESTELRCLKRILAPKTKAQVIQILSKVRLLVAEYQFNIKNRKMYDLKIIDKINNLDYSKPVKKLSKFSKSQPKQIMLTTGQSMTNSRTLLKQTSSIRISKLTSQNSTKNVAKLQENLSKRNNSTIQKTTLMKLSSSPSKSSNGFNKLQKRMQSKFNPIDFNPENTQTTTQKAGLKLMNHQQLQIIKQQVKNKIKQTLKLNDSKTSNLVFQNPQLIDYIQTQVKKVFLQNQFQKQFYEQTQDKVFRSTKTRATFISNLSVQTYSIDQSHLVSHIQYLVDHQTFLEYQFMQCSKEQLLNGKGEHADKSQILDHLPNLYFLKIKQKFSSNQGQNSSQNNQHPTQKVLSDVILTTKYVEKQTLASKKHSKVQKVIQILYLTIKSSKIFDLQRIILKVVQFLFKYETSSSIVFTFYYNKNNLFENKKIQELKSVLSISNCTIAQKQIQKTKRNPNKQVKTFQKENKKETIAQIKFSFIRKDDSIVQMSNFLKESSQIVHSNPLSLYIDLYAIFSVEKLNIVNQNYELNREYSIFVNYDYVLTQILKNHLSSDYFLELKNKALWQHRLRVTLQNILAMNQHQHNQERLQFLLMQQFQNISELNKERNLAEDRIWTEVDDLIKSNVIKMFSMNLKLSLPYRGKAFINKQGKHYWRFEVKNMIEVLSLTYPNLNQKRHITHQVHLQNLNIYLLPCIEKRNILIGLFDAENMMKFMQRENQRIAESSQKESFLTVSDLINSLTFARTQIPGRSMKFQSKQAQYIRNLYIPMSSISSNKNLSQPSTSNIIHPVKCDDFSVLSKNQSNQLIIGDNILWKYNVYLQNGIKYNCEKQKSDLMFQTCDKVPSSLQTHSKKMGIVLFLVPEFVVVYARIL